MKTVNLDTLTLWGANIWVDQASQEIRLEVNYTVSSSADDIAVTKVRESQDLLTDADKAYILDMTWRLKVALEAIDLV